MFVFALAGVGVVLAASTWGNVQRVSIDRPSAPAAEAAGGSPVASVPGAKPEAVATLPPGADGLDVFLLAGSDSRAALDDLDGFGAVGGQRADVVMVLIKPRDGSSAAVLSLPRDLLVDDVCGTGMWRINETLRGCDSTLNGPTTLILTVESLTGLTVDHFALIDLAGFQDAVDAIGGYEICLNRPVRDKRANLSLPGGCTLANGDQTLAWMRSRHTQELTGSGWRAVPGVSDLTRNQRQREFMFSMISRLSDFTSPDDVRVLAQSVSPYVTVDADLGFLDAVGLAWTMRGLGTDSMTPLEVPVADATTESGASVLVATSDIAEIVRAYLEPVTAGGAATGVPG